MSIQKLVFVSLLFGATTNAMVTTTTTPTPKNTTTKPRTLDEKFAVSLNELLHEAVKLERTSDVDILLKLKANPNWQDRDGRTALHYAAMGSSTDIVSSLLNYKADPTIEDTKGNLPADLWQKWNILYLFMDRCGYALPGSTKEDNNCRLCHGMYGTTGPISQKFTCTHQFHRKCLATIFYIQEEPNYTDKCPSCLNSDAAETAVTQEKASAQES